MNNRIFNFSAGPAVLPESALKEAQKDLLNYKNCGMSVMEMSHRSKEFSEIITSTENKLRKILNIPDNYYVLFLQGGASLQFSMIPMNLYHDNKPVDVINTGSWTKKAIKELKRIGPFNMVASSEDKNFSYIPSIENLNLNPEASYVYITSNNTIAGTQYQEFPKTGKVPLVADMSSDILSRDLNTGDFGLIYAGAQKNIGPSGVTLVIIREDLIESASEYLPTMLQYKTHAEARSLYNTPPVFSIYMMKLVFEWIENNGGIKGIEALNNEKAGILYDAIDKSDFYYCPVEKDSRSKMNVVFRVVSNNEEFESKFVAEAAKAGLSGLKGHRSVGGLRASIYNAMPLAGIEALVQFMKEFERRNA